MSTIQPISKRSKRLLEEASRHLCYTDRLLAQLSINEYRQLAAFCGLLAAPLDLSEMVTDARYLGEVIIVYLAERSQP